MNDNTLLEATATPALGEGATVLAPDEAKDLERLEGVVNEGLKTFVEVGNALLEIHNRKLYRASHRTFKDYCQGRWHLSYVRAMHFIDAAKVVAQVKTSTIVDVLPATESQARPLATLPAEDQTLAWETVLSAAPKDGDGRPRVTAALVSEVVQTIKADPGLKQALIADPSLRRDLLAAEKDNRQKASEVRREQRIAKLNQIAQGNTDLQSIVESLAAPERFPVIYADPPWRYEHSKTDNRQIENHYPTMSLEEICALAVDDIATPDAILFLWATSPKLAESLAVVEAWGFTYRTCATWVKTDCAFGMGYYFRQQHELLLVATRGQIPAPKTADRVSSVIEAKPGGHSEKPARVAEIIEAMYPDLPKLELFCRSPRSGWFAWGNQAGGAA